MFQAPKQINEEKGKRTIWTWSTNETNQENLFKERNIEGATAGRTEPKSPHVHSGPAPASDTVSMFDIKFWGEKWSEENINNSTVCRVKGKNLKQKQKKINSTYLLLWTSPTTKVIVNEKFWRDFLNWGKMGERNQTWSTICVVQSSKRILLFNFPDNSEPQLLLHPPSTYFCIGNVRLRRFSFALIQ